MTAYCSVTENCLCVYIMVTNLSKCILSLCKKRYGQVFSALNFTVISVNLFQMNFTLYTGKGF